MQAHRCGLPKIDEKAINQNVINLAGRKRLQGGDLDLIFERRPSDTDHIYELYCLSE